jgi:hypothetical protein
MNTAAPGVPTAPGVFGISSVLIISSASVTWYSGYKGIANLEIRAWGCVCVQRRTAEPNVVTEHMWSYQARSDMGGMMLVRRGAQRFLLRNDRHTPYHINDVSRPVFAKVYILC